MDLKNKHLVLGLTGGIACYKAAELCRLLVKEGATVQVVMTAAAEQFITPVTMQALSNRSVYRSQWDAREPNNMAHINLGREADAILVAPCSADCMARLAQGSADDLLSLMCLARPIDRVPLLLAPAMNREMWAHPATQRNMAQLRLDGTTVLGVGSGDQACGETGDGRMLEPAELVQDLIAFFQPKHLAGQHVLVTAGPTFEAIDPIRGITNTAVARWVSRWRVQHRRLARRSRWWPGRSICPHPGASTGSTFAPRSRCSMPRWPRSRRRRSSLPLQPSPTGVLQ